MSDLFCLRHSCENHKLHYTLMWCICVLRKFGTAPHRATLCKHTDYS